MAEDFYPFVENGPGPDGPDIAAPLTSARIAVYDDMLLPPRVVLVEPSDVRTYLAEVTKTVYELAFQHCSEWSFQVIRELVENLIHASFMEPTVSILDQGRTIVFCDQGPGIPNKQAALKPSFSSATAGMKRYIRGVGSGLPIVEEWIHLHHGTLTIEDNLGRGTSVTVSLIPKDEPSQANNTNKDNVTVVERPMTMNPAWGNPFGQYFMPQVGYSQPYGMAPQPYSSDLLQHGWPAGGTGIYGQQGFQQGYAPGAYQTQGPAGYGHPQGYSTAGRQNPQAGYGQTQVPLPQGMPGYSAQQPNYQQPADGQPYETGQPYGAGMGRSLFDGAETVPINQTYQPGSYGADRQGYGRMDAYTGMGTAHNTGYRGEQGRGGAVHNAGFVPLDSKSEAAVREARRAAGLSNLYEDSKDRTETQGYREWSPTGTTQTHQPIASSSPQITSAPYQPAATHQPAPAPAASSIANAAAPAPASTPARRAGIDAHVPLTSEQRDIIMLFVRNEKIGPKELSEQLGIPNATGSRKLKEMTDAGYIVKPKGKQKYFLTGEGQRVLAFLTNNEG